MGFRTWALLIGVQTSARGTQGNHRTITTTTTTTARREKKKNLPVVIPNPPATPNMMALPSGIAANILQAILVVYFFLAVGSCCQVGLKGSSLKRGSFIQKRGRKGNQTVRKTKKAWELRSENQKTSPFVVDGCTGFGGLNGVVGKASGELTYRGLMARITQNQTAETNGYDANKFVAFLKEGLENFRAIHR